MIQKRQQAGLIQTQLAQALNQHQSFVARLESGQRQVDVIEFLTLSGTLGFDPASLLKTLQGFDEPEQ